MGSTATMLTLPSMSAWRCSTQIPQGSKRVLVSIRFQQIHDRDPTTCSTCDKQIPSPPNSARVDAKSLEPPEEPQLLQSDSESAKF